MRRFFRNVSVREQPVKETDDAASAVRRVEITLERETVTVLRPGATVVSDGEVCCACCGQPLPASQTVCPLLHEGAPTPTLPNPATPTTETKEVK